jgi:muconate cycloisomerase
MPRIIGYELHAIDLPFRLRFKHAAASRDRSESVFLELHLDDGTSGWGEALPRFYVTGETRDGACKLLSETILPRLMDVEFGDFEDAVSFLAKCDGRAPGDWVPKEVPQSAAWCAVDLALLDAFGRSF